MGLIERIKSALGLETSTSASQRQGRTTDRSAGGTDADDRGQPTPASEVDRNEQVESAQTVVSKADSTSATADDEGADGGVDVTVEHEPATETEDAVKGTTTAASDSNASDTASTSDTASASTDDAASSDATAGEQATTDVSADLEDVKGIGPTYADRLRGAGVDGVATLAAADPADLAERADIPESRLEEMVERAGTY